MPVGPFFHDACGTRLSEIADGLCPRGQQRTFGHTTRIDASTAAIKAAVTALGKKDKPAPEGHADALAGASQRLSWRQVGTGAAGQRRRTPSP